MRTLAIGRATTPDLERLRGRVSRFYAFLLWLHVPVIAAIAVSNGLSPWSSAAIMAWAAFAGSVAAWLGGGKPWARLVIAAALTTAPALMVYAGRGTWQLDWHMYFFVVFGMLIVYVEWRPLALAAALTIVHHAVVDAGMFPGVVVTQTGVLRVLMHAGIIAVDCLVLFWIASLVLGLFLEADEALRGEQAAAAEAKRLESYAKQGSDLIMQAVNQGLMLIDDQHVIAPAHSAELERIFGIEGLSGRSLLDVLEPLLQDRLFRTTKDFLSILFDASKKERTVLRVNPLAQIEVSFWNHDGREYLTKTLCFNFQRIVEDGRVVKLFVAVNDVTERYRLERQVHEVEERKDRQLELLMGMLGTDAAALDRFITLTREQGAIMASVLQARDFAEAASGTRTRLDRQLAVLSGCASTVRSLASRANFEYFRKRADAIVVQVDELTRRTTFSGDDYLVAAIAHSGLQADIAEVEQLRGRFAQFSAALETVKGPGRSLGVRAVS